MEPTHFESLYPDTARQKELDTLVSYVKTGNSAQLVGIPGSGRRMVLGFLAYNRAIRTKHLGENQKWFHFVFLDFADVRTKPYEEVVKYLFLSLADSLLDRNMQEEYEKVNAILAERLPLHDVLVLEQGLKRAFDYLTLEKELTVVLLCEKFEEYIPHVTSEFFTLLTSLRNRAQYRFSTIFSVTRPLEYLLDDTLKTEMHKLIAAHTLFLSFYDQPTLDFRLSYLEKNLGKTLNEKQKEEIVSLTGGLGKLAKVSAEEVLTATNPPSALNEFLGENKVVRSVLYEIWENLTPHEQLFLIAFFKDAQTAKTNNNSTYQFLGNLGIICQNEFTIPLFKDFVGYRADHQEKEQLILNEAGEIVKGQNTISDMLTPTEFRLLKYFIQNTDKVLERDDVISGVWTDYKTQQGVSNEALDQVIYRLRKKVEDDANNPTHILTVKGRGFRFLP